MIANKIKPAAQARQHAKAKNIDLENFQDVKIVLVPFDDLPIFHCSVLDRNDFIEMRFGDDEAADVLGQMPWETVQFLGQPEV